MSVSVICACKNREPALRVSLSSWLLFKEISEIIIVDWSSDESIDYLTKWDDRIKVIRVSDKKYFNQPQPLNLAIGLAKEKNILKLDTDYVINPYFNFFEKYSIDENSFVSGKSSIVTKEFWDDENNFFGVDYSKMTHIEVQEYYNSYSEYYRYITGLLYITKENILKVGGYNENLGKYYAFEDDEIYQRLELLGLNHKKMDYDHRFFHIPHPDSKRIENFEAFYTDNYINNGVREQLVPIYQGKELEWQVEYGISVTHVSKNKEDIGEIKDYFVSPKTKWIIKKNSDSYYSASIMNDDNLNIVLKEKIENKLKNFPTSYYVTLEESVDRQNCIENKFKDFGIELNSIKSKRFSEAGDKVSGKYVYQLNDGTKGCCISHLKAIKSWYENTDESYGFFCEDDLSLETVQYWNFTWNEFIESLPEDAECVQLFTIRSEYDTFKLRERYWNDWGATAYILTREYAKKIIDNYIQGDTYHLEIPNQELMPLIENILFASVGKTYTIPLFVENIDFDSTFSGDDDDVLNGQKTNHKTARDLVLAYWKKDTPVLKNLIKKTEIEDLLTEYALDTENPEHNFNLGFWYESQGHTAPAVSYFLRCAERSANTDKDLAYESLIRASFCYEKQGTRDGSARSILWQAQMFLPDRPEAHYLLSRFAERKEWWQDCYSVAELALRSCNFDLPSLRTNVEYPGKHGLLYQKSISGWWWGKADEARELLQNILKEYNLSPDNQKIIYENLKKMGVEVNISENKNEFFKYSDDFDWGTLTYEDIVTIEREISHEGVYNFWKTVKENDIVLDIGASVGAYTISILDEKPKKVYCVEPSKKLLKTLSKNCAEKVFDYTENPLVYINYGIVDKPGDKINIFGGEEEFEGITFNNLIQKYQIDKINYMKIDCEGGEYSIFKEENMNFLKDKVDFIAMEVHLNYDKCREKFKNFRDNFLTQFENYKVMSCTRQNISWGNSIDIKDRIFDNSFIDEYTCEFMIYICNR